MTTNKKVLKDDREDRVIKECITNPQKSGYYWMLTIYEENTENFTIKSCITDLKNNLRHLESIVAQMEVGESSKEKHIHISITFKVSTCKPVNTFNRLFPGVYISCDRDPIYNSYCVKKYTRVKNSTFVLGITLDDIDEFERIEFSEDDTPNDVDILKDKLIKLEDSESKAKQKIAALEEDLDKIKSISQQNALLISKMLEMGKLLFLAKSSEEVLTIEE
jgi:hypothetical protein